MKRLSICSAAMVILFLSGARAFSGDLKCYGYTSTTSHFACNISPYNSGNCVWWAAYMRPDIAAVISGSGWNGGQWYDNLKDKGFDVGSEPKVGAIVEFSDPGHVAYVESLGENGSFNVSEMDAYHSEGFNVGVNYATYYKGSGNTYHRNTDYGISKQGTWTLKGFIYRNSSGNNPPGSAEAPLPYNVVGNVAWYPPNKSCVEAERWKFFSCGYPNCGQSLGSNDICYDQENEMRAALGVDNADWYLIIYGTEDLDKVLTCHQ